MYVDIHDSAFADPQILRYSLGEAQTLGLKLLRLNIVTFSITTVVKFFEHHRFVSSIHLQYYIIESGFFSTSYQLKFSQAAILRTQILNFS